MLKCFLFFSFFLKVRGFFGSGINAGITEYKGWNGGKQKHQAKNDTKQFSFHNSHFLKCFFTVPKKDPLPRHKIVLQNISILTLIIWHILIYL
ncbi:MAG: hypothetical protein IJL78_10270 [Lachnospiraceae bacterium]|nr:hypothetical protein [Lachnospiraceae bacterium]